MGTQSGRSSLQKVGRYRRDYCLRRRVADIKVVEKRCNIGGPVEAVTDFCQFSHGMDGFLDEPLAVQLQGVGTHGFGAKTMSANQPEFVWDEEFEEARAKFKEAKRDEEKAREVLMIARSNQNRAEGSRVRATQRAQEARVRGAQARQKGGGGSPQRSRRSVEGTFLATLGIGCAPVGDEGPKGSTRRSTLG